jgi:hypothetical protein
MADKDTMLYRTNAATFELPVRLKDKTMHMFTMNDNGPSDFSMVISYAELQSGERLDEFGDRLSAELSKALPKFHLKGMTERVIDDSPAIELAYSWRNEGHFMHQRQVITVVQGETPGSTHAMLVAATFLTSFNEEWSATFDAVLTSMKLSKGKTKEVAEALPPGDKASRAVNEHFVFVLSERRRMLRVFSDREEACRNTDAREVERGAWAFFDSGGIRLHPNFVVPNSGTIWRKAGSYVLESRAGLQGGRLQECLHRAALVQAGPSGAPFADTGDVRAFLDQQKAG